MGMFIFTGAILLLFALYGALIAWYRKAWTEIPVYSTLTTRHSPPTTHHYLDHNVSSIGLDEPPLSVSPLTTITVLIPVRNEENNITACLESLSRQTYPMTLFQVIIIDDHSTDGTWPLLQSLRFPDMQTQYLQLADTAPDTVKAHKKFAIERGVHQARGELIVTTDADCSFHPDWLTTLAGFYEATGAKFIAAPVKIGEGTRSATFLAIFQTLDFVTLQGITGAAVHRKFHSMCNGANLAYQRSAFLEVDGFRDIDDIPSGDDMFLMHKIYKKYPSQVFFCKSRQAIVTTRPETHWKGFVHQRIRWASKADRYDDKRIFRVLLLVYVINLLFLILLAAAFWNSWYLYILLALLLVKTIVEFPFVGSVSRFFGQQRLMVYFPLLQPFHIIYTIVIGWLGKFGSYQWKERKITK